MYVCVYVYMWECSVCPLRAQPTWMCASVYAELQSYMEFALYRSSALPYKLKTP